MSSGWGEYFYALKVGLDFFMRVKGGLLTNMEKGLLTGILLLDLRKVFDLVDTDILLKKLLVYQCDKNIIAWIKSYLQCV